MQKITPFLWFDGKAEEAANFYVSIFKNAKILSVSRYGDAGPAPTGTVMTVAFELDGQKFVALNGGPQFTFSPATSFVVNCERRPRWTNSGRSFRMAARRKAVAGSPTSSASRGRSSRRSCPSS